MPGIREELERDMFNTVTVIGAGRAGSAIAARLRERGIEVRPDGDLRLLCVPDRVIAEVARSIEPGPVGRTRLGRDSARGARPAPSPLLGPSTPDPGALARPRAARRSLGCRDRRGRRSPLARTVARGVTRPAPVPARRRRPGGCITRARRSRRTSSSRCTASQPGSSKRPVLPPRRSCLCWNARSRTGSS